jgi:phosphopantetheine adenylyltransferase
MYEGLTVECCKKLSANYILRGIRYVNDFEYEKAIADMNRSLDGNIETVFLTCLPKFTSVASTLSATLSKTVATFRNSCRMWYCIQFTRWKGQNRFLFSFGIKQRYSRS